MAKFEGQERRMPGINACLKEYGMNTLEDARDLTLEHGINVEEIVKGVQPIAFDNAVWAYTLGTALALKKGAKSAAEASEMIGVGLQAFCVPGSVAEHCPQRQQGPQGTAAGHPERFGQGRCLYHQPGERLYLCRN